MKKALYFLCFISFVFSSCELPGAKSPWTLMKLYNGKPNITIVNLGDTSHGKGDGTAYEGDLMDSTGKVIGEYISWYVTVDIEKTDSNKANHFSENFLNTVLSLGPEDEIIIQGGSFHSLDSHMIKKGIKGRTKAIVGGTGKYRGIRGEVVPYRLEDGTHVHDLIYRLD